MAAYTGIMARLAEAKAMYAASGGMWRTARFKAKPQTPQQTVANSTSRRVLTRYRR
jgi:hypothetical protein